MDVDQAAWTRRLAAQDGVVSRAQALACGWTRGAIAHRVRSGHWQTLVPRVLLTVSGTPTRRQLLRGALLHAGPQSALGASTACRWHGLACAADNSVVHIAVPAAVRVASTGYVRVHPTVRTWWSYELDSMPVVPIVRAVIDAALAMSSVQDVRAVCAEAVQRRRASPEQLVAELASAQSAGSAIVRRVLAEVSVGARSAPEAALLRALRGVRGLPPYALNVDVHTADGRWLARPDVVFAGCRVVVEVDGWRWHRDPQRQRADLERHTRLEIEGWTVLRYAAVAVLAAPDDVARQIAAVVLARAAAA